MEFSSKSGANFSARAGKFNYFPTSGAIEPIPPSTSRSLLENGQFLLLENGQDVLLEA